jgi:hypothetical protein
MTSNVCRSKRTGKELTKYLGLEDALRAAEYALNRYQNSMVPYQCNNGNHWHLCPKDRYTPSTTCNHCTDGSGRPKQLYQSKEAAEKRARIRYEEDGIRLNVYECCHNRGWHLTKNDLW